MSISSVSVENLGKCYTIGNKKLFARWGWVKLMHMMRLRPLPPEAVFQNIWALRHVAFDVRPGEALGIIGHNGAGKTTLLKVLGRITCPTEGKALVVGRVVSLLEMGLGFQPDLSARENIFLNAAIHGFGRRDVKKHLDEIIAFAELERFVDSPPLRHFSSGMYLRLAFSVAINMAPDVLLADEILAVGDLGFQDKCIGQLRQISKKGSAVLFVSHDMDAVERLCDRCIRLQGGRLVDEGPPSDVIARYKEDVWTISRKTSRDQNSRHVNEYGEILSVDLLDVAQSPIGIVKTSDDFFIRIVFEMFAEQINIRCGFDIHVRNTIVFRSIQPQDFFVPYPGVYQVLCRLPRHLLLDVSYWVNAFVTFLDSGEGKINKQIIDFNALSLRVYNPDKMHGKPRDFLKTRPYGVVGPSLDWDRVQEVRSEAQRINRVGT